MVFLDTRFNPDYLQLDFFVSATTPTHKTVEWILTPQPDTEVPFPAVSYNLYYSILPNKQWTKLNSTPLTETTFSHTVPKYVKVDRGYYEIEAIDKDGKVLRSSTRDIYVEPDKTSLKMLKEFLWWLMDRHGSVIDNIPVLHYVKKTYGQDCSCKQPNIGVLKSNCPICLGTGYVGGYYDPVLSFITYGGNFNSAKTDLGSRVSTEVSQQGEMSGELSIIDVNDFIREIQPPYRLFNVASVSFSEYNGRPMKFFVQLQVEESGHPLYKLKPPTFVMPTHIHYFKVREIYEQMVNSINKTPKSIISGFPAETSPTVVTESSGLVRYRQYLEQDSIL